MGNLSQPQDDGTGGPPVGEVSELLRAWSDGDRAALDSLTPIVYGELHRLAGRYMKGERPGHSLQTTALVNEAYMRLVDYKNMRWQNRAHFFAVSAQLMRRILVDHARRRNLKRGGGVQHVSLDQTAIVGSERAADLAKRQVATPLRPQAPQEPCDHGLFSDQRNQLTLPIATGKTA